MAQSILVVEDDRLVADAILGALGSEFEVIVAESGSKALDLCREQQFDLILMDILFPEDPDGIEVTKQIRANERTADVPILMVTGRDEIEDKEKGFGAGADDYLTKPFSQRELQLRVMALLRRSRHGKKPATVDVLNVGLLELNAKTFEITNHAGKVLLTPVEFELMRFLMSNPDEVFSADQLLQKVWGYPAGIGMPDLVRVHVKNVREKIEPNPRKPIFLRNVLRRGYMVPTTTEEDVERVLTPEE